MQNHLTSKNTCVSLIYRSFYTCFLCILPVDFLSATVRTVPHLLISCFISPQFRSEFSLAYNSNGFSLHETLRYEALAGYTHLDAGAT